MPWTTAGIFALAAVVLFAATAGSSNARGQETTPPAEQSERPVRQGEVLDDPPAPRPTEPPPGVIIRDGPVVRGRFESYQVNVGEFGVNIPGDAANEPSIAIDPTNPDTMVIGWRQFDSVASNFRQAGYAYSYDRGQTWVFPGVIEPGVFRSDPVLDADPDGNIFYFSLTDVGGYHCDLFKAITVDGAVAWTDGVYALGGDKGWMAIDRTDGIGRGNIYIDWRWDVGCCYPNMFSRSTDVGESFDDPVEVPGRPARGTIAVGPDGEVYAAGATVEDFSLFHIAKSTNAQDPSQTPSFDSYTVVDMGGSLVRAAGPNPAGILGQVWVAVDHSTEPTRSNVYILCSVDPPGSDPMDVMFVRSENGGLTWSDPVRINDDSTSNGAWQWFGTLSVAPNGRLDVIWNDTRHDLGGYDSELYYACSADGGRTWAVNTAITPAFDPHLGWPNQNKIGDYYDMISDDEAVSIAYAATFNGEQDVYFVRVDECESDRTPPSPHPMTWDTPPEPVSTSEITMTATEATDESLPVEYYFRCELGDCTTSGWIADRVYNNAGLVANTEYAYKVRAQDSADPPNRNAWSDTESTFTHIETPTGISFGTVTSNSIEVTADGSFTNLTAGDSGIYFEMTPDHGTGANVWVQSQTITVSGLTPGTWYTFNVKARNQAQIETGWVGPESVQTSGGAVTGACCYGDGYCIVEESSACGGDYQGDGTDCDPNPCCALLGDMNNSGEVDGRDIDDFVRAKLGQPVDYPACADYETGTLEGDIAAFIDDLLAP